MRRGRSVIRRSVLCLLLLVFTIAAMFAAAQETERVGLRLIAVNTEKEAASLQMQLQAGGAFENLAKKYSTAPSAAEGGWLGLFQIAGLRPEFQDALKGLVPGQVSPVLKVNEEYLLLKLASEAETHAAFGCELAEQRKLDAAVSEFREALRINPQYAQAHYYLGAALFAIDPQHMTKDDQHGFRAIAERSRLADAVKDSGAATMFPETTAAVDWLDQLTAQSGWDHFREKDFRNLKSVYGVSWVVLQKPVAIGFPCPYENPTLEVCRID